MSALAGAFSKGATISDSKKEKREALEIQEIRGFENAPPCFNPRQCLLVDLRKHAKELGTKVSLKDSPIPVREALARSTKIARLCSDEPMSFPFSFAFVAPKDLCSDDELAVICLGMDENNAIKGAIGYWPSSTSLKEQLRAASTTRIVLLAEETSDAVVIGHPTIIGAGEDNRQPQPATQDFNGPPILHMIEAVRLAQIAKAQVNARMQRGGASEAEKAHVKMLMAEAQERLVAVIEAPEFDADGLNRAESAWQGFRKQYLPREWEPRCASCSMRHSAVESATCKYWARFAQDTKAKQDYAAARQDGDKDAAAASTTPVEVV